MKILLKLMLLGAILFAFRLDVMAQGEEPQRAESQDARRAGQIEARVVETDQGLEIQIPAVQTSLASSTADTSGFDPLTYTLGPDDVVEIEVMRHPEFSGAFPINQSGKLQYKFVGDMDVIGLTKAELEEKISDALLVYLKSPAVTVTIMEYRSKVFYVLGEVGSPGKYFMRSESIPVREAVFAAGLPTSFAAMRKCKLITPSYKGRPKTRKVNIYNILYGGNLNKNINMHPGDVLYVPSTVMGKIIRVINPAASMVGAGASLPEGAATGLDATDSLRAR
ncbi:MAG: polysaccharide biosynthesis/export family protein [Candidatus Omnitrophota bacterium]|nr:polysaccharide export protein [Candidatus Omnitrophota bacterium]